MFYYAKVIKLKLNYCLIYFLLYDETYFRQSNFSKNAFLPQKFKNKIPFYTFLMKRNFPVLHEMKCADCGSGNA